MTGEQGGPDGGSDPGEQLVEVVDEDGTVVDVVPRWRIRRDGLRHRCTYVAVLVGPVGPVGELVPVDVRTPVIVHQRADWKDTYPSHWDVAFGGLCGVGEDWRAAAARELAEEAGITGATLTGLGRVTYDDGENRIVGRVYVTSWPGEPTFDDGEVVAASTVPLGELAEWAKTVPVCPDSAALVIPRLLALLGRGI